MTHERDPTRLQSDHQVVPGLRSMLADARADVPSAVDVERLSLKVQAAIVAGGLRRLRWDANIRVD